MPEHRRPEIRFPDVPRGTCRWCGFPIRRESGAKQGDRDYRRRWHPACVDAYNESDPREARRRARKRDRGVCRACGLDTNRLRRSARGRGRAATLRALGFVPRRSLWELDHVVPLIDGDDVCWGVLDLDSWETDAFDESDDAGLRRVLHAAGLMPDAGP